MKLSPEQLDAWMDTRVVASVKVERWQFFTWWFAIACAVNGLILSILGAHAFSFWLNFSFLLFDIAMLIRARTRLRIAKLRESAPLPDFMNYYFLSRRVMVWEVRRNERRHKWQAVKHRLTGGQLGN